MSLGIIKNGQKQVISGLNTAGGQLIPSTSDVRTGTIALSSSNFTSVGSSYSTTVTFSSPFVDDSYEFVIDGGNSYRAGVVISAIYEKKADSIGITFTRVSSDMLATPILYYTAYRLMTDENRALDEQAIADIQAVIPSTATSANILVTENDLDAKQDKTLSTTIAGASTVEGALGALNDADYEHFTVNAYSSTVIKISGFKANASSASGETFVLRQRGAETVILTFGNNTQDTTIDTNYHAIRLYKGIGGTPKITKLQFDYTNRVLYVTVASFGALSFAQIAGQKDDLTYETGATVPDTDVYDISIIDIVTTSDLTSTVTSGSTAPVTSGGVYSALNTTATGTITWAATRTGITISSATVRKIAPKTWFVSFVYDISSAYTGCDYTLGQINFNSNMRINGNAVYGVLSGKLYANTYLNDSDTMQLTAPCTFEVSNTWLFFGKQAGLSGVSSSGKIITLSSGTSRLSGIVFEA